MKQIVMLSMSALLVLYSAAVVNADPLDPGTFSVIENQQGSVIESGGVVSFTESMLDTALYFYDDDFVVDSLATTLSFDYEFTLGQYDVGDYLQLNVNYTEQWYVDVSGSGHIELDLTPYQGTMISLDWALIWNGDQDAGTTASICNIDIAQGSVPVPEPTTLILFGTGLAGLITTKCRKKNH